MKWFFACNENLSFYELHLKAMVYTACRVGNMEPFFIYDGSDNPLLLWLKERGVQIIRHRFTLYNDIMDARAREESDARRLKLDKATGAFLRVDIPLICKDLAISDEFVLYTDCDVIFQKELQESDLPRPKYFASSVRNDVIYSGLLWLNVEGMLSVHEQFLEVIRDLGYGLSTQLCRSF